MCKNITNGQLDRQYSRAFYAAVLMMLGGDTYPSKPAEELFASTVMLLGIFTTSVIIGSCASLLASMGKQAAAKQDHFDRLNTSLSYHKVTKSVSNRVRAFIEYLYASGNMGSEDLYRYLPQSLQTAVEMEKKKPLISAVSIFKDITPACTVAIVHALQQVFMPPREYIVVQGQTGSCMYFITRGVVQITVVQGEEEIPIAQLKDGSNFGESALISDNRRSANVLTLTHSEMEKLDQYAFERICEQHVELADLLRQKAQERSEKAEKAQRERKRREAREHWKRALQKVKQRQPLQKKAKCNWKAALGKVKQVADHGYHQVAPHGGIQQPADEHAQKAQRERKAGEAGEKKALCNWKAALSKVRQAATTQSA